MARGWRDRARRVPALCAVHAAAEGAVAAALECVRAHRTLSCGAFGVAHTSFRELGSKALIFYGREVRETPFES
jgi:hypothetical protein